MHGLYPGVHRRLAAGETVTAACAPSVDWADTAPKVPIQKAAANAAATIAWRVVFMSPFGACSLLKGGGGLLRIRSTRRRGPRPAA